MEKIPCANRILPLECGFGIGYCIKQKYKPIWVSVSVSDLNLNCINQKYQPIWVSVSVSDLNQNRGFGCTLMC